jgi:hypothetical protein
MAATYSYVTGDGVTGDYLALNCYLPDNNGGNLIVNGSVKAMGNSTVPVSASLALPLAPASGSIFFIIECNRTTGVCALLQSTSAFPAADPNNDIIFQDVLTPTTTDPAIDPNNQVL